MIPAEFDYEVAESADHAVTLLREHGEEAKLLAGGHSLLPLMKLRLAYPSTIVDIGRLTDLSYVREEGDGIAIGALTCHEDLHRSETLQRGCPIVAHTAGKIGDPQVRHRGTIGGSVAHGDPASDLPSVLVALGAELVVRGGDGDRTVPATDFFEGIFEVDLSPQEILTEIRVPKTQAGWSYVKFAHRAQDWATVGVAVVAGDGRGGDGTRVALTSMGETPLRATGVEQALASGADPASAAQHAGEGTHPVSDPLGSAEYRAAMVTVMTERALKEALSG
ncbi:xanthine dehydrogenase family protein subunit M [soil metagenome]